MITERIGWPFGRIAMTWYMKRLAKRAEGYNTKVYGEENLLNLDENSSAIVAANHIGPVHLEGKFIPQYGLTPDVFVVQNAIVNNTGKWAVPIAANNADWVLDRFGEKGRWLHRWITAFERGFLHGGGTIPVEKSRERTKKHFLLLIDRAVKQKKILTFFVEGVWRTSCYDYAKEGIDVKFGAINFSKQYNIPIVPMYVYCADAWESKQKIWLSIGKPIKAEDRTDDEFRLALGEAIISSQRELMKNDNDFKEDFDKRKAATLVV